MIIDWHTHAHPPEQMRGREQDWSGSFSVSIERSLEEHEKAQIDLCVVSNAVHYIVGKPPAEALSLVKRWNEYAAEVQQKHADRVVSFASTVPAGGSEYIKELERAIRQYGLHGVLINSSHEGIYPDSDDALPFWELMNELQVPVMMHAPSRSLGGKLMDPCRLASSLGRPMDEAVALARLIVLGTLERFPKVKLVVSHLGGGICEYIGRMDYAYEFGDEGSFLTGGPYEPLCITKSPIEYLKGIYLDTVSYHAPAVLCAMQTVGARHLLFGSDAPPMLPLLPRAKRLIEELAISDEDRQAIFYGNAAELLGLKVGA